MTSAGQRPDAADPQADALDPVTAAASGPAATSDTAPTARATGDGPPPGAPEGSSPLVSLSSLLGGEVEGGAVCAADGTCD